MKIKEITETDYFQKLLQKTGMQQKQGMAMPRGSMPKGNIKSPGMKPGLKNISKQIDRQLIKPGAKITLPTNPNQEQDFEIDKVDNDDITLKNLKPKPGQPEKTTMKKSELDPAINNMIRRQRAQNQ